MKKLTSYKPLFIIFTLFLLSGCDSFESQSGAVSNPSEDSIDPALVTFTSLNQEVFGPNCSSCHTGQNSIGGIGLSTFQEIISSGAVVSGNPQLSSFYTEVSTNQMPPPPLSPLSAEVIERIRVWILEGALENALPVIEPIQNQSALTSTTSVSFVADAYDAEGGTLTYQWLDLNSANQIVMSGATSPTLTLSNLVAGAFQYEVIVTDNFGDTASRIVNLSVTEGPNSSPVINPGPNQQITLPVNSVTFNATASDSDGTVASYSWTQFAGPSSATLSGETTPNLMASNLNSGLYSFQLSVTDDDGAISTAIVSVEVARATPSFAVLKSTILDAKCARCHMNGVSRGGYEMNTHAEAITRVTAGEPGMSALYIRTSNETMPPVNAPEDALTSGELSDLQLWIERGAPNN